MQKKTIKKRGSTYDTLQNSGFCEKTHQKWCIFCENNSIGFGNLFTLFLLSRILTHGKVTFAVK